MPIYEYQCEKCGYTFSVLRSSAITTPPGCGSCGSPDVKKLVSSFSCACSGGSSGGGFGGGGGFSGGGG